ncbi:hypothetical protein DICPUDRAFT_44582 [Dictyostelium purpureum]|uniref:Uncharacterized protein n=1 Tax=Dictyostelium purpureum TaxID=5786 RepID=F0Z6S6_DICPU|nr:uncharacterized protein DICPUDRAFT_44582 [Dictyostelium purpureum]EGC40359.1 hypothetical protein DICPUDRAFT_44582 [Dictyostelium purpureum]|eukprot:XP_003283110.1 hypothetical protein DICPUDRAFT_44582 [Dictyostelium purpureum]
MINIKSVLYSSLFFSLASADFTSFITPSNLNRYNLKREKVEPVFDLDNRDYVESLVVLSFPGVLLSIFIIVLGLVVLFLRNCISIKKKSSKEKQEEKDVKTLGADFDTSSIISDYQPSKTVSSKWHFKIVKFFVFIIIITTIVGVILGLTSNSTASKDLNGFFSNMELNAKNAKKTGANLVHALAGKTDVSKTVVKNLKPLLDELNNMTISTHQAKVEETNLNLLRQSISIMGYVVAIITCAWGIFGVANGKSWTFMLLCYLSLLSISITLLSMGLHIPLSAASSDLCNSLEDYLDTGISPPWMKKWIDCEPSPAINKVVTYSQTELDKLVKMINLFSVAYTKKSYTVENIKTLKLDELRAIIPIDQVPLFDSKFDQITIPAILSVPRLENIAECKFVKDYFNYTKNNYCDEIIDGVNKIVISEILISVIWIPGFIFAVIYSKDGTINNESNSNSNNNQNNHNNEEGDEEEEVRGPNNNINNNIQNNNN